MTLTLPKNAFNLIVEAYPDKWEGQYNFRDSTREEIFQAIIGITTEEPWVEVGEWTEQSKESLKYILDNFELDRVDGKPGGYDVSKVTFYFTDRSTGAKYSVVSHISLESGIHESTDLKEIIN